MNLDDLVGRCSFPPERYAVDCAVSGGADSLALMALARRRGLDVMAIHVDHGLRPGSASEADLVRDAAGSVGAQFRAVRVELDAGSNLEARARAARYGVLPSDVLTGHTADDQAETVVLALLRGSGPAGVRGIDPRTRPLLGLRRAETVAVCRELGLEPFDDPSNGDPRFARNRVRHEVIPLLNDIAGRDVVPLLCRTAEVTGRLATAVESGAAGIDGSDVASLRAAAPELAAEALRRTHRDLSGSEHLPDAAGIERLLAVVSGATRATQLAGGWTVRRTHGRLVWEASTNPG